MKLFALYILIYIVSAIGLLLIGLYGDGIIPIPLAALFVLILLGGLAMPYMLIYKWNK